MLGFTAVGFWLLRGKLGGEATITIDTDWVYRKAGPLARVLIQTPLEAVFTFFERLVGALTHGAPAPSPLPRRQAGLACCCSAPTHANAGRTMRSRSLDVRPSVSRSPPFC